MKTTIPILMALFCFTRMAQGALIQAPGASSVAFQRYLNDHPTSVSYADTIQKQFQNNKEQENKIVRLGDTFNQDVALTLLHLKGLQQEAPLTILSLRYMKDLTEKSLSNKNQSADKQGLHYLHCKSAVLLNEGISSENCEVQIVSLASMKQRFPLAEKVMVESLSFSLNADSSVQFYPRATYHWNLISNSQKPLYFFGTYEQLMQQNFTPENLVNGTCEAFTTNTEDFNALNPAHIFFSENCQKISHEMPVEKSWVSKNKTWLYTGGAVLLGALAYSMKDKTLVFNSSALK